jgi:chromosome segregation ATPase
LQFASLQTEYESNKRYLSEIDSKIKGTQKEMEERIQKLQLELKTETNVAKEEAADGIKAFQTWAQKQKSLVTEISSTVHEKAERLVEITDKLKRDLAKREHRNEKLKKVHLHEPKKR